MDKDGFWPDDEALARMWPAYVNMQERSKTEIPFLLGQLACYGQPRIFNAALGSGATTIGLHHAGITDIISNEISDAFVRVAQEQAHEYGVPLCVTQQDWRHLPREWDGGFDAVLNLGNSLTCMLERADQLEALRGFRRILKPNGMLIIDERNYAHHFLADPSGALFRWSGKHVYCGKDAVRVRPVRISEQEVEIEYAPASGHAARLCLYPFKEGELRGLLQSAGFESIKVFGDYKERFAPQNPEFLTYVARS